MFGSQKKYYLLVLLISVLVVMPTNTKSQTSIVTNTKSIKTQKIDVAQLEIKSDSFTKNIGLHGEITLAKAIPENKYVYFTLLTFSENIVWKKVLKWDNNEKNSQEFVFPKDSFEGLSDTFLLKIEIKNIEELPLATINDQVEITNTKSLLNTSIEKESSLSVNEENITLNLKILSKEESIQSKLKISFYQDFLNPKSKTHEEFVSLGDLPQGSITKEIILKKPVLNGNHIISAQVVDYQKKSKSGVKVWNRFFPGTFFNFKYLRTNLELSPNGSLALIVKAEGKTNKDSLSLVLLEGETLRTRRTISFKDNNLKIEQKISLPNQKAYKVILKIKDKENTLNKKIINIENPFYKKVKRTEYIQKISNLFIHNNKSVNNPKIPFLEIIQLFLIGGFLVLSYILFKKNKRF